MFGRMEDFHINNTSQDYSFYYYYDPSNITFSDPDEPPGEVQLILFLVTCIITAIGFPLTLMAIYVLSSLVRNF